MSAATDPPPFPFDEDWLHVTELMIGQLLDQMVAGRAPANPVERKRDAYVEYTERVDIDLATL